MDGFDVARRVRRIGQRSAQVPNAARESRLAHCGVTPDGVEQLVFRDEPLGMLDEMAQDREHLRREIQKLLPAPRPLVFHLDANRGAIGPDVPH